MASTIVTKNSSTASAVPVTGDLTQGELAVNVTDKKLYTKDSGGTVVKLVGGLGNQEANAVAITGGSINGTTVGATTASTGAFTTLSASSTTTLSGGTANGVAYLNGSKVVTTGSALTFDGSKLAFGSAASHQQLDINLSAGGPSWNFGYIRLGSLSGDMLTWGGGASGYADIVTLKNPTNNPLIFGVNNTEQMRLTSTGLGIGTSSPAVKLDVAGNATIQNGVLTIGKDTVYDAFINTPESMYFNVDSDGNSTGNRFVWGTDRTGTSGGTEWMRLDSSGQLGIGQTSPAFKLDVTGPGTANASTLRLNDSASGANSKHLLLQRSSSTATIGIAGALANDPLWLSRSGGYDVLIDSSGNLLVGTTNNSNIASAQGLYLRATGTDNCTYGLNNATTSAAVSLALFYSSYSTANQTKFEVTSEGNVKSRTNSYAGFSDERLKQNITPASSQWNDIKSYDVVKFQMKSEQFSDEENPWMLGVVAQQVEQTSPGLVDVDAKDGMKTVKYSILYMKAVKALQEAMARIEQLEADVAALKGN
jgi:hypothetical protein